MNSLSRRGRGNRIFLIMMNISLNGVVILMKITFLRKGLKILSDPVDGIPLNVNILINLF